MSVQDAVNKRLADFYKNGCGEVGLEVGADAGLSPEQYVQIPASFKKTWAYRLVGTNNYDRTADDSIATLTGKPGWTVALPDTMRVVTVEGKWYVRPINTLTGTGQAVDDIYVDPCTYDDVRRFIVANTGHVRDGDLKMDQIWWVHATRFWGLITGLITGSKQREYTYVADPTTDLSAADAMVDQVLSFQNEALTAIAARATSWRKSNHATGGTLAAGFPRRWLTQMKWWPTSGDQATVEPVRRQLTDAFYVATHAAGVHNVLAMMAHTDEGHWACIDPQHGILMKWDIRESTMLRMAPKTQVAGTAWVVDAMVVLRALVGEGLAPLLENISQWQALNSQFKEVERGGVAVAAYAAWFLDGHPNNLAKRNFNQKDSTCADLIGELGAVARRYYKNSTIGQSMALDNAMNQAASETSKNRWAQIAREKTQATQESVIKVYGRITGAAAGKAITDLASDDKDTITAAVGSYNAVLMNIGKELGIVSPPQMNALDIVPTAVPVTTPTPAAP
jgi:hypothetical protein